MPTEKASDTLTATGGEDSLATITDPGTYVLAVDLSNMEAGDVVTIRLRTKLLDGSDPQIADIATFAHVQARPNVYSVPIAVTVELAATLEQEAGSSRDFDWAILEL